MRKSLLFICLSLSVLAAMSQRSNITGQINHYSKVTEVIRCSNRVVVDSPGLFAAGMQVLIIQMQGATIYTGNNGLYGSVTNYNSAGNYEIETVDSILSDTIKFRYQLERAYDASGSVQLMPLPIYNTANTTGKLTCQPWNGSTGGILLLKADSLILNDSIKISGMGFRGYYSNDSSQLCFGNLTDYYYTDSMHAGPKGEGIAQGPYNYGRGREANGGGGGDNQNTGGGGGGNYGKGGPGGVIVPRTAFCSGNGPGDGGSSLGYNDTLNKVFLGGGGGCGHGNNSEGTPGTNGGGLCIIIANTLVGNSKAIVANGLDQTRIAGSDGAGGGGAGGTVLLAVGQYAGNLTVSARGGAGGRLDNDNLTRSCMGPGGGGGGGALWVSQASIPSAINPVLTPGTNGLNLGTGSTFCPYGVTNGALPGDAGGIAYRLVVPVATVPYIRLSGTASNDTLLCNNQQVTLSAAGVSSDTVYYHWSTGQLTPSITFLATQSATYTVSITDRNTCTVTKQIELTVDIVQPAFSGDTAICSPANITLHADNPGTTPVTYAWSTGQSTPSITFFADSTRTYTVTVSSAHQCRDSATIQVSVGNLSATFSPDTTICDGSTVTIDAYPTGGATYTYAWSTGESTATIDVSPSADEIYTVTVSAGGGCSAVHQINVYVDDVNPAFSHDTAICTGSRVTLHADNQGATPVTYSWSTGDATPSITVSPTAPQLYSVTVTSAGGCSASAAIDVNVGNLSVTFSDDTVICPGNSVALLTNIITGNNVTYQWSTGDATPTITVSPNADASYAVTVSDDASCMAYHTYQVHMDYLGVLISDDTTTCIGGTATLIADVPNTNNITYAWSTGETTQQVTVTNDATTTYSVTVTGDHGCTGSAIVSVHIDSVRITGSSDTTICPGSSARVYALGSGIGQIGLVWSTGQTGSPVTVSPASTQRYRVTATDSLGCRADTSISVQTDSSASHLTIQVTATPDSSYAPGDSIQLSVTGSTPLRQFAWTPGGTLSDSTIQRPIATPLRAVQYCVTVTDSALCMATLCTDIAVAIPEAAIAIPTAFTPNNDNKNDLYRVAAIDGTAIASVRIYDRWGELIYESQGNAGWDGTVKSVAQPSEVYTCFVSYYQQLYPEKVYYKMGTFTLIR